MLCSSREAHLLTNKKTIIGLAAQPWVEGTATPREALKTCLEQVTSIEGVDTLKMQASCSSFIICHLALQGVDALKMQASCGTH